MIRTLQPTITPSECNIIARLEPMDAHVFAHCATSCQAPLEP
jgi:hypothetical protein